MRILLSAANFCVEPLPVYPLGMSVIANVLAKDGHEVTQFDPLPYGRDSFMDAAEQCFREFNPDIIAVSIRNIDVADSQDTRAYAFQGSMSVIGTWRRLFSGPIILGGPGFSMNPEAVLEKSGADYGVAGEGEDAMRKIVDGIAAGNPPPKGTVLRMPASGIYGARYSHKIAAYYDEETHTLPVQTKRGCPFHCVYCTYPMLEGHRLRLRPLEDVLGDVAHLKANYPDVMLYFTDSIFNDPGHEYLPLLKEMIKRDLSIPWTGFITPFNLSDEDIDIMAQSGLVCADLGVDGTTDTTLKGLGKNFSFQQVKHCCERFLERKIGVNANAMFGAPGETWDTVREGIANMLSLAPVYSIVFSGIRLLSGAPLIETAREQGCIPEGWDDTQPLYYYAPGIDSAKLHEMLLEGFKGSNYCIYPPSSRSDDFRMVHKYGYAKLKKMELSGGYRRRRKREANA